jgi:hypothetical protein
LGRFKFVDPPLKHLGSQELARSGVPLAVVQDLNLALSM